MARLGPTLIALACPALLLAQEPNPPADPAPQATPKPEHKPGPGGPFGSPGMRRPGFGGPFGGPDSEKARQAFQQMTPEEKERWVKSFKQFSDLPPEKKMEIFHRSEYFRKKMKEDVEDALKQSGLNLSDEQKKKFAERYFEERRVMEEDLRKQMDELRKPKIQALVEKLKTEFAKP